MNRFAVRTVKNGTVTINGQTYRPREDYMAYDGRLDGQRFAFGLYPPPYDHVASLWGTEAMYRADTENAYRDEWDRGGSHIIDGTYVWEWWSRA